MAEKCYIKQHDLEPDLEIQLLSDTDPVDLSQAQSALFLMSSRKTGLKAFGSMTIADQTVTSTLGVVTYTWQPGDTDTVGDYNGEVQITWPVGKPQTFPANGYFTVTIQKDLGP